MAVRYSIGYMPDNFGVYDGMKVWEFLDFFAVAYQIPRNRRKQVIGDVLELLDLTHKRDDFVNGLLGGGGVWWGDLELQENVKTFSFWSGSFELIRNFIAAVTRFEI